MPTPVSRTTICAPPSEGAADDGERAAAAHRVQRVFDHVHQGAAQQPAIQRQHRHPRRRLHVQTDTVGQPGLVWRQHFVDDLVQSGRRKARDRRRRKARKLAGDRTQQADLREDGRHAAVDDRPKRRAAVGVHALEELGLQLNRRQRVLDVVCDLPRHVGPRRQSIGPFQLGALALKIFGHLVERFDQPAQLVGRRGEDARVEVAAGNAAGRAREPLDRVAQPFGRDVADGGAKQDEEHRRQDHPAVERRDFAFDLLLAQRERHGENRAGLAVAHGHRGHACTPGVRAARRPRSCSAARGRWPVPLRPGIRVGNRPEANRSRWLVATSASCTNTLTS